MIIGCSLVGGHSYSLEISVVWSRGNVQKSLVGVRGNY